MIPVLGFLKTFRPKNVTLIISITCLNAASNKLLRLLIYKFQVKANGSSSQNVLSSRGDLIVADCIPPLHRQILLILTHCEPSQPFIVQHQLNQRLTRQAKLGDFAIRAFDSQNEPTFIRSSTVALHGPKPLYL